MPSTSSRTIPSLDGLRAASVGLVIAGHYLAYLPGLEGRFPFAQLSWAGQSGVDVFFVISGFLITYILLQEHKENGAISLWRFYLRRFFRIFPPFYVYLASVVVLSVWGFAPQDRRNLISAATYTWNYMSHAPSWLLGHTWSLSLEEQFYLAWPPLLVLLGKRKSRYLAVACIVFSPALRLATYVLAPSLRGMVPVMLHTRLDTIMFGCAIALFWDEPRFHAAINKLLRADIACGSIVYILIAPILSERFQARYDWLIGYPLRGLLISIVMLYVVCKPATRMGYALNLAPVRHLGVISYSLYLWQQMFTAGHSWPFPVAFVALFACAEGSYWLVERPSLRARDWIEARVPALRRRSNTAQKERLTLRHPNTEENTVLAGDL
jgi:peptidoglycan/LPS O-acetylase OafA/YrhL